MYFAKRYRIKTGLDEPQHGLLAYPLGIVVVFGISIILADGSFAYTFCSFIVWKFYTAK